MRFLYNLFVQLYSAGISVAALWNRKAAQWQQGRTHLFDELAQTFQVENKSFSKPHTLVWVHSASAGEFEQAKPVIEALKKSYPDCKILATFFSPSGLPAGKKFALADFVTYLPLDTEANANRFVELLLPQLVVFIKYDFWYHHLKAVHDRGIPLLLVSAIFRREQSFFKSYGGFYRNMLHLFTQLFVQDETSHELLKKFGINHCIVAGDTRFDRVLTIAQQLQPVPYLDTFCVGKKVVVAGSTWPDDETFLQAAVAKMGGTKLVIAPHEITAAHLNHLQQLFQNAIRYSQVTAATESERQQLLQAPVLIIDSVGLLSRLYQYSTVAYVGGGFTKSGIHNTLEAAVFGKPVLIGPNYKKFREAKGLLRAGGAYSYSTERALENRLRKWLTNVAEQEAAGNAAADYVRAESGATEKIMQYIQEKRLLTNL